MSGPKTKSGSPRAGGIKESFLTLMGLRKHDPGSCRPAPTESEFPLLSQPLIGSFVLTLDPIACHNWTKNAYAYSYVFLLYFLVRYLLSSED